MTRGLERMVNMKYEDKHEKLSEKTLNKNI